jgi:hypothetical protein
MPPAPSRDRMRKWPNDEPIIEKGKSKREKVRGKREKGKGKTTHPFGE